MKLLLLDIETAPNKAFVWGLFNQNINIDWIQDSGYTMCYAAKWFGEDDIVFDSIHRSSEKQMLRGIHRLLDEADAVITYNGRKFDIPTLNKEFLLNKMRPPSPYKHIDLLRTARDKFRFPSNKLDYISKALGHAGKVHHRGPQLWLDCMNGDAKAWTEMEEYNRGDVLRLEEVYIDMRPWIDTHPNRGLYEQASRPVCPKCGGNRLQRRGQSRTISQVYARYQCQDCGGWCRSVIVDSQKKIPMRNA